VKRVLAACAILSVAALFCAGFAQDRRPQKDTAPKAGDKSPDFELTRLEPKEGADGKEFEKVKLSGFKDKKDVVLVFASYT
jgi:hypothetical protein